MRKNNFRGPKPAGPPASPLPVGDAAGSGADAESLLQALPWGVVVLDAHGTVLRLNQRAAHWWGVPPEALQGQRLGPATAGDLPAALHRALQQVAGGPPLPAEFFLPRHRQWIAMTCARRADGWVVYWQDVTAQKQREREDLARQAARDALRRRTEAVARTGSYELTLATGQFQFSDGLFRLFGEAPGAFVPSLSFIDARSHPDDVAAVAQVVAQAVAGRRPYHYQRRIYWPDGQLRTLEAHGQVECDAQGRPVKLLGLLQDVTAREQAARELLRVKDELAQHATDNHTALYNSMDEGFCIVEVLFDAAQHPTDYRFLDVNPAFEKQTGLHGARGQTIRALVPAHEQHWFDAYGRVARTGEPTRFEAHSEAMGRWFDVNAFPIGAPPNRHVGVLFTDSTERKRTEEALHESDAHLRQAVGLAHLGICDWDHRTDTMRGNDERFLMLGLDPAQDVLSLKEAIELTHPDDRAAWAGIRQQVAAQGEFQATYRIVRPGDGAVRWLSEVGRVVEWQGDEPARVSSVLLDVTADHEAAEALRQSEEQFRLLVTATSDTVYRMGADWTQMEQLIGKDFLADTLGPTRTWTEEYIPAEDLPPVQAAIAAAIGQKSPLELEHRVRRADGTVGWTYSRAIPVLDARGELTGWLGAARDVSARKQAEEALRQSEERLRRMMNVPHVGLLTFSFAGTLLTANDAFLDLMGYGRAEFEARTFTWQDFTPPEYGAESQRQLERVQQTGLGGPYEKEYLRRDGSRQWLMFVAAALGDGTLVKYAVDISAQKQAKAGLRESEQRQRVLIENLPGAAVFVVDRELRYQLAEGEALRQAGFEPADFLGRSVREITPPEQWPTFQAVYEAALAGHPFEHEHAQSGRIFFTRGVPLPGPTDAVLAVSYDITARRAAEEAVRVSEAKYRTLFESMDQGFGVGEVLPAGPGRAADFRWLEVNPQVERLTGMAQAALLGGETMRTVMPQLEDIWYERYERVALTGEPVRFEQHAQVLGRWFDVHAYPLDGPAPHRIALLFTNITERKQAEEALRHAEERHREQLEQQVAERTQELRESRDLLHAIAESQSAYVNVFKAIRDEHGRIVDLEYIFANSITEQLDGGRKIVGRRYLEVFPEVENTGFLNSYRRVIETGVGEDRELAYTDDKLTGWFRSNATKLGDGVLVVGEDITARKVLEQGQAQSLALLQQSEAVAVMGSWEYDLKTREFTCSDGLYRLFERPVGSVIQLQLFLDAVLDDDRPVAARLLRILTTGTAGFGTTLRLRIGDAVKTVRFKGVPLPDAPGRPERVLGVCLDVSDVQRLEAENLALKLDRHKELLLAILQAQEDERRRLGEVLHNGLGQVLYATKLRLDQLDTPALRALPALAGPHQETVRLLAEAMRQNRTLAHELVPTSLADFGLAAAVRDVCRDLSTPQLRVGCQIWGEEQTLPQPVQVALFRLAQELAHNIVRHAGATQATLELETLPGGVSLRAEDNGRGFDPLTVAEGLGLRTVRDAVALLGGTVAIDSSPKFGTYIRLRIPLPLFS